VDITVGHALREEQFLIYAPHPACRASVAGRQLRRFSVSSLRAARSGWAIWHGATVVKVSAAPATLHLSILQCT
jgi:hypothetical protein